MSHNIPAHGKFPPQYSRLSSTRGWVARKNNKNQWIEAEFQSNSKITGVQTKGRGDHDQWVIEYKISYSTNGDDWSVYANDDGKEKANLFVCQIMRK